MSFPLFKDVGKNANDLLKKGFPSTEKYNFRLEYDTTSSSGVQVIPYLQETFDKNVEGELKTKFSVRDFQFTTIANTKEDVSIEISPKTSYRGFKWIGFVSSNLTDFFDKLKGKVTSEFRGDFTTTAVSFESNARRSGKSDDSPKVNFSTVVGSREKGISVGLDSEVAVQTQQLKTLNTALAINKPNDNIEVTLYSKTKIGGSTIVGMSVYQRYLGANLRDVNFGGDLSYDLNGKSTSFLLGGSCCPDEFSTAKGRFDSRGILGFAYTEKWRNTLAVTFSADWNILGVPNVAPLQYGIKLAFK
jgi:hypothetical protein